MKAEELEKRWAAKRLGLPREQILRVEFREEEEQHYSTVTVEPAMRGANVVTTKGVRYIDLLDTGFGELLRELIAMEETDGSH